MSVTRQQILAKAYQSITLFHAISRLIYTSGVSHETKRALLHQSQMKLHSIIIKIVTAWKGPKEQQCISEIDRILDSNVERVVSVYSEAFLKAFRACPSVLDTPQLPIILSHISYVGSSEHNYSEDIPGLSSFSHMPVSPSWSRRKLNRSIFVESTAYSALHKSTLRDISSICAWLGVPFDEIKGVDEVQLTKVQGTEWNQLASSVVKPSAWTKILRVSLPSIESFVEHAQDNWFPSSKKLSIESVQEWRRIHCNAPMSKSGIAKWEQLVSEVAVQEPNSFNPLTQGTVVLVEGSAVGCTSTVPSEIPAAVTVSTEKGLFTAKVCYPKLSHIFVDFLFSNEFPEIWEVSKGTNCTFTAKSLLDASACLQQACEYATKFEQKTQETKVVYAQWRDSRLKLELAKEKLPKLVQAIEELTGITAGSSESKSPLDELLGESDAKILLRISRKLKKMI